MSEPEMDRLVVILEGEMDANAKAEAREKFYGEEIAPILFELGKKCEANGLNIVAVVEWAPNNFGRTNVFPSPISATMRLIHFAAVAAGNFDLFMIHVRRWVKEVGPGNSVEAALVIKRDEEDRKRFGL